MDDPALPDEREAERIGGHIKKVGKARRKIGEAVEDIGDKYS